MRYRGLKTSCELDPDKKAEKFRDNCIDKIKARNEKLSNVYFIVGDIVARNRDLFKRYY